MKLERPPGFTRSSNSVPVANHRFALNRHRVTLWVHGMAFWAEDAAREQ